MKKEFLKYSSIAALTAACLTVATPHVSADENEDYEPAYELNHEIEDFDASYEMDDDFDNEDDLHDDVDDLDDASEPVDDLQDDADDRIDDIDSDIDEDFDDIENDDLGEDLNDDIDDAVDEPEMDDDLFDDVDDIDDAVDEPEMDDDLFDDVDDLDDASEPVDDLQDDADDRIDDIDSDIDEDFDDIENDDLGEDLNDDIDDVDDIDDAVDQPEMDDDLFDDVDDYDDLDDNYRDNFDDKNEIIDVDDFNDFDDRYEFDDVDGTDRVRTASTSNVQLAFSNADAAVVDKVTADIIQNDASGAQFDINLYDANGQEVQPGDKVEVTLPVFENRTVASVYHLTDDGIREEVTDFTQNGNTVTFLADTFSVYGYTYALEEALGDNKDKGQDKIIKTISSVELEEMGAKPASQSSDGNKNNTVTVTPSTHVTSTNSTSPSAEEVADNDADSTHRTETVSKTNDPSSSGQTLAATGAVASPLKVIATAFVTVGTALFCSRKNN